MKALLLMVALATVAAGADVPKPEKIIDDYVRAQGGSKALGQIRTETITGNLTEPSTGKTGSYSLITKAPDRLYTEIILEPDHAVEAYNGMSGWGQNPTEGVRTLTGVAAKEMQAAGRYANSRLADIKKDKFSVQVAGVERVRGRDAYHVRLLEGPGMERDVFFDTQTHLIVREATPSEQFDYDDYRSTPAGIRTPFHVELHRGGREFNIAVTRAEFNSPVEDSVFSFPRTNGAPLPDAKALLWDVGKNQKALEAIQKQYTCRLTTEEQELDPKGNIKSTKKFEFEVFHRAGEEVRHLVGKDGMPLTGDEKKKADDRFNTAFEKLGQKEADLANDPKKRKQQDKEDAEDEADFSNFLRAIRFSNARHERFRGEEVIAVDFGADPNYKPKKTIEGIAQKLAGVMWIDEQALDVARMEGHFSDSVKIAGGLLASLEKGSSFVIEQAKVNGEVWMPVYDEVHFKGRLLFMRAKANQVDRWTDCKKFHADSKFVVGQD